MAALARWPLLLLLLPAAAELQAAMEACGGEHGASGLAFTACLQGKVSPEVLVSQPEVVRNYSCSQDDLGSPVVKTVEVSGTTAYDACEANAAAASTPVATGSSWPEFVYLQDSYLPAGDELFLEHALSAGEAVDRCLAEPRCEGFTFQGDSREGPATVYFKSATSNRNKGKGWHTYVKMQPPPRCGEAPVGETRSYQVEIIREEPLVAMVKGFAAPGECDLLVEKGGDWEKMGRAHTSQGGHSPYRRSYSSNIYPDLRDTEHELTRFVARMFAVTRNLTGYSVYPPGQEPVNAVLYREIGDEYRPHCDGDCHGRGPMKAGERIATSILYCQAAELGGHTSFTEGTHKVVPVKGDLLLFAYRLQDGTMSGKEAEHSGCPVRQGRKWIATQWYREGVSEHWNWQDANALLRGL